MMCRLALALPLLSLAPAAWADFHAEYEGSGDTLKLSRIEVAGNQMRMDSGNVSILFDTAGSGKMIILMHDKKQFMDFAKVAEVAGAAMAQANAALANLPPEQRAMVEARMHGAMGAAGAKVDVQVTPTGASDRAGGFACQIYRTDVGGRHSEDTCLADVGEAGISAADRATVRRAFEQMKTMSEKMTAGMFRSPVNQIPVDKFPVRITHTDDNGKTQTVLIKGIASGGVNVADFAIPAGYTEQEMDMGRGHRH